MVSLSDGNLGVNVTNLVGTWVHAVAVWDRAGIGGSADTMRLYVNGNLVGSSAGTAWGTTFGAQAEIGGMPDFGSYRKLYMDDLKLYSSATVAPSCPAPILNLSQSIGLGSLRVANVCGTPYAAAFSTFTLDTANAFGGLGSGWFGGLHISFFDVFAQWSMQAPPFFDTLNASGASSFDFPAGTFTAATGLTIYGVTAVLHPLSGALIGFSYPLAYTFP